MTPTFTPGYILDGHVAVVEPDPVRWAVWRATHRDAYVAVTDLAAGIRVSTTFLGVDMNHQRAVGAAAGPPLVFETMVFDDYGDAPGHQRRYATWVEAEVGHNETVEAAKARLGGAEGPTGRG